MSGAGDGGSVSPGAAPARVADPSGELATLHAKETLRHPIRPGAAWPPRDAASGESTGERGVTLVPRPDDLRYVRTLGEGGMGRVYLARQPSLRRGVAVKTATDPSLHQTLVAEAVITGMLEHPNIPPVHQLGEDAEGHPVLVMKRIEGAPWSDVLADPDHPLRRDNPLFAAGELDAHLEILLQIAAALHFAHTRGVIHRDVKPANVMIGSFGEVMLIDWGVAFAPAIRPEQEGSRSIVGSPAYMAPEMVLGDDPDPRTDVYLLGSTLHEVLVGHPPHAARSALEAMGKALEARPLTFGPGVPSALAAITVQATSYAPDERPPSALAFAQALRRYLQHRTASEIADRAAHALDTLEALHASASPAAPASAPGREPGDEDRFETLAQQCRFSVVEALRAWPESPLARRVELRLPEILLERALARGDLPGARSAAKELRGRGALGAEPEARLAQLEARDQERERLERERDLEAGRRQREVVFALVLLGLVPLQLYRWFYVPWQEATAGSLLVLWAMILLPPALVLTLFHARFAHSADGGRVARGFVVLTVAVGLHRALQALLDPPVSSIVTGDLILGGAVFGVSALWLGLPLLAPAAILGSGAVLVALRPDVAGPVVNASGVLAGLALIWAQRRVARARAHLPR
jgi:eukaryotic-like serine/threonine-protein kinase